MEVLFFIVFKHTFASQLKDHHSQKFALNLKIKPCISIVEFLLRKFRFFKACMALILYCNGVLKYNSRS